MERESLLAAITHSENRVIQLTHGDGADFPGTRRLHIYSRRASKF